MTIIFDTETTGLPVNSIIDIKKQPKIIEFAAIKIDDDTLEEIDRIDFKVNPKEKISKKITEITGLTDEDLVNEKPFSARYDQLVDFFLGEKYLVAHNIEFDMNLLKYELIRLGKECQFPYPPNQICTVTKTHSINGYRLNLGKLYNILFGKEMKSAHRAMVDVEYLTECYIELKNRKIIK
jgi:DNA polymerase-3 subunit alpha (Gram-positive type)